MELADIFTVSARIMARPLMLSVVQMGFGGLIPVRSWRGGTQRFCLSEGLMFSLHDYYTSQNCTIQSNLCAMVQSATKRIDAVLDG
jgi:hypothetical protein